MKVWKKWRMKEQLTPSDKAPNNDKYQNLLRKALIATFKNPEKNVKCNQLVHEPYWDNIFQFDMKDFCASIKEELLHEAMQFDKEHAFIKTKDIEIIFQTWKPALYNDENPWVKKDMAT